MQDRAAVPGQEQDAPLQSAAAPAPAAADEWAFRTDGAVENEGVAADSLLVRVGVGRYLLPMSAVREVGRVPALTRLPGTPHWVAGAGNWRGRVLAVLDLAGLLGEVPGPEAPGRRSTRRLVVVREQATTLGLLVDLVEGVGELAALPVGAVPATTSSGVRELLGGQVVTPSGPVALLDLAGVLNLQQTLPRPRALVGL